MLHLRPLGQLSVYVIPHFFQKLLERTDGKNNKIFNFRTGENPVFTGFLSGANSQLYKKFRVSPVMTTSIRLHISCDIFRHHNDNIIHQKKSFVNHFLSFPVSKALLNMLRSKNIIITSSAPSSMLTAGISCIQLTVTIVSIAIITIKASNAGTQQITFNGFGNGFGSMGLVPVTVPASKSISHNNL